MGFSHGHFVKYPRTPHLFGSRGTDDDRHLAASQSAAFLRDQSWIVEEKLDGTNVGTHFPNSSRMVLQCRGHEITEGMHPQYDLFKQWTQAMATCKQDSKWHAEGDVWTHTQMVCCELQRLPEWGALERERQVRLLFAALFHDSGKPATTVVEPDTRRVRSPDHALVGARLARTILRELGCPLLAREAIASIVRFHSRPAHLLEKPNPEWEVIHLSWLVNNQDLHSLALADSRGRVTHGEKKAEEPLGLWRMLAEEQGCYQEPYAFKNDRARFLF
jgi:putative nucleotidyltransferase with HDIG domain